MWGIIIDAIVVGIVLISTLLGYKKGLIKLGVSLLTGLLATVAVLILYRPIGAMIINGTKIDETIESEIAIKVNNMVYEKNESNKGLAMIDGNMEYIENAAGVLSENIVYSATIVILFIALKIAFKLLISITNVVTKVPVIAELDKVGGIVYGIVRGLFIICLALLILNMYIKVNPGGELKETIESTYITQNMIKYNVLNNLIPQLFKYK